MAQTKQIQKQGKTKAVPRNVLRIVQEPGGDRAALLAQTYLRPTVQAAATVQAFNTDKDGGPELMALIEELSKQTNTVHGGDMRRAEAMLLAQAHSLDAIFGSLARRAKNQEYLRQYETYMRLALKAQSQCRATLEALANIKNPRPVAFVQQANIASGAQQINNGSAAPAPPGAASRAGETENAQSELLENRHGERLDAGTASSARAPHSRVEALDEIDRPEDTGWERARQKERIQRRRS